MHDDPADVVRAGDDGGHPDDEPSGSTLRGRGDSGRDAHRRIGQDRSATSKILIEGGRITAVGAAVSAPAGARVLDLGAYTLLPGLIDAHTHMTTERPGKRALDHMTATGAPTTRLWAWPKRRPHAARRLHYPVRGSGARVRLRGPGDQARYRSRRTLDGPRMQVALTHPSPSPAATGILPTASARPSRSDAPQHGVADGPVALRVKVRELIKNTAPM